VEPNPSFLQLDEKPTLASEVPDRSRRRPLARWQRGGDSNSRSSCELAGFQVSHCSRNRITNTRTRIIRVGKKSRCSALNSSIRSACATDLQLVRAYRRAGAALLAAAIPTAAVQSPPVSFPAQLQPEISPDPPAASLPPCADCQRLERCRTERLACSAAQVFALGGKRWQLAPRNDATTWRHEFLLGQAGERLVYKASPRAIAKA